jgi:hypothetical protein
LVNRGLFFLGWLVLAMSVLITIDAVTAGNDSNRSSYGIVRPIRYR